MFDFDPRDLDRDEERYGLEQNRGSRGGCDPFDRDDDWRQPETSRDRDDDARTLGREPDDSRSDHRNEDLRTRDDESRWGERDRDPRDRDVDPRDVFTRDLSLPRGRERELVRDHDTDYRLRGSETRMLATVGSFRVVPARDLRDHDGRSADPRQGDLRHLREAGLARTVPMDGRRDVAVVLTERGRDLLEHHRTDRSREHSQTFYAELKREREMEHDAQVYAAYLREAERLRDEGAHIERVRLDYELRREYQRWLHERDRDRDDYDGHHDRTRDEIERWAYEHHLPFDDDHVRFPDVRIEYEDIDGRWCHRDVEVMTLHYRGSHAASRAGFTCVRGSSSRCGGSPFDRDFAEDFL